MGNKAFGAGVNYAAKQAAKRPNKLGLIIGAVGGVFVTVGTLFTAKKVKNRRK